MKSIVIRNSIVKLICFSCIFIFVKQESDLIKYALIMAGSGFLGQAIMWFNLKNKIIFVKPMLKEALHHFRPSLAFFISNLAIKIYVLLDITMLEIITHNEEQVGIYSTSKKVVSLAIAIVSALGAVIMPKMSRLFIENKLDDFKSMIYKSFTFVNFLAFPMTIGLIGISNNFSVAFFANKFDGITPILIIACLLIIIIGWSNVLGIQVLLPMRQDKQFSFSTILGAVINFLINLIVISRFNALGAIISCVLSEIAVTAVQFYFLRKFLSFKMFAKTFLNPLMSSFVMLLVLAVLDFIFTANLFLVLVEIAIGGLVYLLMMYLLKDKFFIDTIKSLKNKFLVKGNQNEKV